jgi:mannosyltransferase OCH1-like enzyme
MGICIGEHDYVSNAFMASVPGHHFWKDLLHEVRRSYRPRHAIEPVVYYVMSTTGPRMLDKFISRYSYSSITVFPSHYFCCSTPFEQNASKSREQALLCGSYTVHHFSGSWLPDRVRVLMKMIYWLTRPTGLVAILILLVLLSFLLAKAML